METYIVLVYQATVWSFLTQSDHYSEYRFCRGNRIQIFASVWRRRDSNTQKDPNRWIMPGAILEVYRGKEAQA